jgi:hypothetical protein
MFRVGPSDDHCPTRLYSQISVLRPAVDQQVRFNPAPGHLHMTAGTGRVELIEPASRIDGSQRCCCQTPFFLLPVGWAAQGFLSVIGGGVKPPVTSARISAKEIGVSSPCSGSMICRPIGRPSGVRPAGAARTGRPGSDGCLIHKADRYRAAHHRLSRSFADRRAAHREEMRRCNSPGTRTHRHRSNRPTRRPEQPSAAVPAL